jgi:hypothetical protein
VQCTLRRERWNAQGWAGPYLFRPTPKSCPTHYYGYALLDHLTRWSRLPCLGQTCTLASATDKPRPWQKLRRDKPRRVDVDKSSAKLLPRISPDVDKAAVLHDRSSKLYTCIFARSVTSTKHISHRTRLKCKHFAPNVQPVYICSLRHRRITYEYWKLKKVKVEQINDFCAKKRLSKFKRKQLTSTIWCNKICT